MTVPFLHECRLAMPFLTMMPQRALKASKCITILISNNDSYEAEKGFFSFLANVEIHLIKIISL